MTATSLEMKRPDRISASNRRLKGNDYQADISGAVEEESQRSQRRRKSGGRKSKFNLSPSSAKDYFSHMPLNVMTCISLYPMAPLLAIMTVVKEIWRR